MLQRTNKRIPRPKGLTLQCRDLFHNPRSQSKDPGQKTKQLRRLKEHILNQYFLNNQHLNNIYYSTDQIAQLLNLTPIDIIRHLYKRMGYLQGWGENITPEDIQGLQRVVSYQGLNRSLHHAQLAEDQYVTLRKSQGDMYKPFISSEVNRALTNLFASDANLRQWATLLSPKQQGPNQNLFIVQDPKSLPKSEPYLTVEKATILLEEKGLNNLLSDPTQKLLVAKENDILSQPEVRATYQKGSKSDKGSGHHTVDTEAEVISPKPNKHQTRREKDYQDIDDI